MTLRLATTCPSPPCPPLSHHPHLSHSVIVLEDNDVLHLTGGGYGVYNTEQQDVEEAVPRVLLTLAMEVEQIMKVWVLGRRAV